MYTRHQKHSSQGMLKKILKSFGVVIVVAAVAIGATNAYAKISKPSVEELAETYVRTSGDVDEVIVSEVRQFIIENNIRLESDLNLSINNTYQKPASDGRLLSVKVPVTDQYSTTTSIDGGLEELVSTGGELNTYRLVDVTKLSTEDTLLSVAGEYYLDTFSSGAVFEELVIEGKQASELDRFTTPYETLSEDKVFSMHTTGVTALTREMMNDLNAGVEPTFFSEKIADFLSAADITHVSNEVSFKEGCTYSATLFCSPPEFIETLKASGVDIVELTGNHNNDVGSRYNTSTIETYTQLGWSHVGGGLNTEDASKPYIVEKDGTTFGMLAYNYPDAPSGGAISGPDKAGANAYTDEKMKNDIASLKEQVDFIQVNIQFWECYAYPDGYVEFPECDLPIGEQEPIFKSVIDAGADMVVGSSAHQPQTYEKYNDGWIYYGLGNLYFDQDRWPGTERGLILTNYYVSGTLIQTRITPTVYGSDFQTRKMTEKESEFLLNRLNAAR